MTVKHPEEKDTKALRLLFSEAFGDGGEFLDSFFKTAFSPKRCRCITENGEALAALYWFDCEYEGRPLAYLYAIATKKSHRGKGLCLSLMQDTHRHLKENGYIGALLSPAEPSLFDFYARLGYKTATYIGSLSSEAYGTTPLRRIDAEEYGIHRRRLLPEGAVIEGEVSLRFLEKTAELYMGDNVLFAAQKTEKGLFCPELLGDITKAPAILGALGISHGVFRTVGKASPLTMFLPFEQVTPPKHFSLVFD